jgi:hypothetical protein
MNGTDNGCWVELDSTTTRLLMDLAQQWGMSREETIRRAVEELISESHVPNERTLVGGLQGVTAELQSNAS